MECKTKKEAIEELKKVNNNLTYLMRQKRALQDFIKNEEELDPKTRAFQLQNDETFINEYGRKRTALEISLIMHYSERQIYRFLKEEE